jgi:hypothetical protein
MPAFGNWLVVIYSDAVEFGQEDINDCSRNYISFKPPFLQCSQNLWHAINIENNVGNNLQAVVSLNEFQYETILLASGMLQQREHLLCISRVHLDYGTISLHQTRARVQRGGHNLCYIVVGEPAYQNTIIQARNIGHIPWQLANPLEQRHKSEKTHK